MSVDRLVIRYQDSTDTAEQDAVFERILRHCLRLPVVAATRRKTFGRVCGQAPRFADDELQAVRRAVWRSARRWDRRHSVPFDMYASRGIKMALRNFWTQEAWLHDLPTHVPVAEWKKFRRLVATSDEVDEMPDGCPLDLWNACSFPMADEKDLRQKID